MIVLQIFRAVWVFKDINLKLYGESEPQPIQSPHSRTLESWALFLHIRHVQPGVSVEPHTGSQRTGYGWDCNWGH